MTGPDTAPAPETYTLDVEVLVAVWLDGFTSGASSGSLTMLTRLTGGVVAEGLGEQTDALAQLLVDGITTDPLTLEEVRAQIRDRIADRNLDQVVAFRIDRPKR